MGRLVNGINGPIQGTVGTVVGSSRYGVHYLKGYYKKRTTHISAKEKSNRGKFAQSQYWLKPILEFVREGFKHYSPTVKGFVAAKSYLSRNAFEGVAPDVHINPALVKVSYGDLPLSNNIAVALTEDGHLQFTWDPASVTGGSDKDQVMMLAYDIENAFAWEDITGQLRSTGADRLKINTTTKRTYHVYCAFNAADRSKTSDSVYLGAISV
jgi:hypothetical protein